MNEDLPGHRLVQVVCERRFREPIPVTIEDALSVHGWAPKNWGVRVHCSCGAQGWASTTGPDMEAVAGLYRLMWLDHLDDVGEGS